MLNCLQIYSLFILKDKVDLKAITHYTVQVLSSLPTIVQICSRSKFFLKVLTLPNFKSESKVAFLNKCWETFKALIFLFIGLWECCYFFRGKTKVTHFKICHGQFYKTLFASLEIQYSSHDLNRTLKYQRL